jgi:biotin carboxyl carrier protein
MTLQIQVNEQKSYLVENQEGQLVCNHAPVSWDSRWQPNGLISVLYQGQSYTALVEKIDAANKELALRINGQTYTLHIKEPIDQLLSSMGLDLNALQKKEPLKAPMPGMVLKILVSPGQTVSKGDGLLILEAMKMENVLKAAGSGVVKNILVTERVAVEKGALLIEME